MVTTRRLRLTALLFVLAMAAWGLTACGSPQNPVSQPVVGSAPKQSAAPVPADASIGRTGTSNTPDASLQTFGPLGDNVLTAVKTNQEGPVTIKARLADSHPQGDTRPFRFSVTLDTHSVDLDAIDLARLAVLRNDRGDEVTATRWEAPRGGHHVEGTLSFPGVSSGGAALHQADTKALELIVRTVGNVSERRLVWSGESGAERGAQ